MVYEHDHSYIMMVSTTQVHKCSKFEVMAALRLVLCPTLASSSIKACLR